MQLEKSLPQGTRVRFSNGENSHKGTGIVCGISTIAQPVIGRGIIIEVTTLVDGQGDPINYEYTHIVIFESDIKEIL